MTEYHKPNPTEPNWTRPDWTTNDRVAAYFEHITGRPMTREEKIPLGVVIHGQDDNIEWPF